jgi:hypothetical protein
MIIDTSALLAILFDKPDGPALCMARYALYWLFCSKISVKCRAGYTG